MERESDILEPLVRRAQRGDREAAEQLVRRTQGFLFRLACHLVGDHHAAQDALQEAYLVGLSRLVQLREPGAVRAWLARIVTRECWKVKRPAVLPLQVVEDVADQAPDPHQRAEDRTRLRQALACLTTVERAAVVLRDVLGFSYEEVSQILDIPLGTVKSRLFAGRSRMEEKLRKEWA